MEFIPIVFVAALGGAVWLYAFARERFVESRPEEMRAFLPRKIAFLQERLEIARRENWDPGMVSQIVEDLETAQAQFERLASEETPE